MQRFDDISTKSSVLSNRGSITVTRFLGKTRSVLTVTLLMTALNSRPCLGFDVLYRVVDLGVLTPGGTSSGVALNNSDQVAGYGLSPATNTVAAATDANGHLVSLGTLGTGRTSAALGISQDGGAIVGQSEIKLRTNPDVYGTHAFLSTGPGTMQDLHDPNVNFLYTNSAATGINDRGRIVGFLQSGDRLTTRGFFSDIPGVMLPMGTLGGRNSQANGVNHSGMIVGTSDTSTPGQTHAVRTSADGLTLNDLGGSGSSTGNAINDAGHVVGAAGGSGSGGGSHAFFSTGPNVFTDLGVLNGTDSSVAMAINNKDVVVGKSSLSSSGTSNAFIVFDPTKPNTIIDLNSLIDLRSGWILNSASGINLNGDITGTGKFQGQDRAFLLLAAVPEPSILVLATLGGAILLTYRLRRGRTGARADV